MKVVCHCWETMAIPELPKLFKMRLLQTGFVVLLLLYIVMLARLHTENLQLDDATEGHIITIQMCVCGHFGLRVMTNYMLAVTYRIVLWLKKVGVGRTLLALFCVVIPLLLLIVPIMTASVTFWPKFISNLQSSSAVEIITNLPREPHYNVYREYDNGRLVSRFLDRDNRQPGYMKPSNSFRHYVGEDVTLSCDFEIDVNIYSEDVKVKTKWIFERGNDTFDISSKSPAYQPEGRLMSGAARQGQPAGIRRYLMLDRLPVHHLTEQDFGDYTCHATIEITTGKKTLLHSNSKRHEMQCKALTVVDLREVVTYHISRIKQFSKDFYVPPGGILWIPRDIIIKKDSEDQVSIQHRVNGQLITEQPKKCDCMPWLHLFSIFLENGPMIEFAFRGWNVHAISSTDDIFHHDIITDIKTMCMTKELYGIHTLRLSREVYDPRLDIYEESCVGDETIYWVGPSFPGLFGNVKDSAHYAFFAECWENDTKNTSDYCTAREKRIMNQIMNYYFKTNLHILCLFLLGPLAGIIGYCRSVKYLLLLVLRDVVGCCVEKKLSNVAFMKNDNSRTTGKNAFNNAKKYDVFLAYSKDKEAAAHRIRSLLTSLGQRIFDCHRDVPETRQPTAVWDDVLGTCTSVILLTSQSYFQNPKLQVLFRCIYDCLLHEELYENRILLVRTDDYPLPPALGPLPVIDLPQWRQLQWWVISTFPTVSTSFTVRIRQGGADFYEDIRCLTRHYKQSLRGGNFSLLLKKRTERRARGICLHNQTVNDPSDRLTEPNGKDSMVNHGMCVGLERPEAENNFPVGDNVSNARNTNPDDSNFAMFQARPSTVSEVLLIYGDELNKDREVADKVKAALHKQGLRVKDAANEVLAGQAEAQLIPLAASCQAFIVIRSPAFCQHPLTRRLHLHQVHQALNSRRLRPENVLFVDVSGIPSHHPQHQTGIALEEDVVNFANSQDERIYMEESAEGVKDDAGTEDEDFPDENTSRNSSVRKLFSLYNAENDYVLLNGRCRNIDPSLLETDCPRVIWSSNLSDDDHLLHVLRWGQAMQREFLRNQHTEWEEGRLRYLEARAQNLYERPLTLMNLVKFLV